MLHTSKLRSGGGNGFIRALRRFGAALVLAILLPVAASAYTVVLRNGRSLDIPAAFTVTSAGITYEHAPGLYVTIQMTSIDIAATERANNETAGSLMRRARAGRQSATQASVSSSASGTTNATAPRTLTDKDLAPVRARREASEALYERRRAELGLPSMQETRRQREEESRRLSSIAAEADEEKRRAELYWRTRAAELREAIAVNDAEIDYVRARLAEITDYPTVSFTSLSTFPFVWPLGSGFPIGRFPFPGTQPGHPRRRYTRPDVVQPRGGFGGSVTLSPRGPIGLNPRRGPYTGFPRRRGFGKPGVILPVPIYPPFTYNYNGSYDESALLMRLRELEAERAGLQARRRLLEEEARRAGAPPGWLRL